MHDIIPIFTSNFNGSQINSVNARRLYEFLGVKKDFCKDRLPRQEYINRGYFVIKKTTNEVGRKCESYRITPKGFEYFAKKLNISK